MSQTYLCIVLTLLMKNGLCRDMDLFNTTMEFLQESGFSLETHIVTTEDGYLLTIHRIPGPPGATPVFFQHGIIGSSDNWLLTKTDSLGYMFASLNYDIWLGNFRTSIHSKSHKVYNTSDERFWNFSFHEMGTKDLTAMIDYVADYTKQKVVFIGFSLGTTAFFVMGSENAAASSNIRIAFALAPMAFTDNLKIPNLKFLFKYSWVSSLIFGKKELKSKSGYILSYIQRKLLFMFSRCEASHIKSIYISEVLNLTNSTTSVKTIRHFVQQSKTGKFRQFDYGTDNSVIYNSIEPPEYKLSRIRIPVVLFVSEGDVLATINDSKNLWGTLPNIYEEKVVNNSKFCHIDFLYGSKAQEYVYNDLIDILRKFEKEQKTI